MVEEYLMLMSEGGMIAVVGFMFMFLTYQNSKRSDQQAKAISDLSIHNEGQTKVIEEISKEIEGLKGIIIKLIDKHTRSDSKAETRAEKYIDSAEKRHMSVISEINDVTDSLNYLKGRINGRNS